MPTSIIGLARSAVQSARGLPRVYDATARVCDAAKVCWAWAVAVGEEALLYVYTSSHYMARGAVVSTARTDGNAGKTKAWRLLCRCRQFVCYSFCCHRRCYLQLLIVCGGSSRHTRVFFQQTWPIPQARPRQGVLLAEVLRHVASRPRLRATPARAPQAARGSGCSR